MSEIRDIETLVCTDIKARQKVGIKKYGVTVAQNPLSEQQWLQHAYEESLDLSIYLKRIIESKEQAVRDSQS